MMFLIRTAFWLSVAIFFIPVDEGLVRSAPDGAAQPIGAFEAVHVAQTALDDVGGFCERNPEACDLGGRVADTFLLKARTGAMMLVDLLGADEALPGAPAAAPAPGVPAAVAGTLTPDDLEPAWRGPAAAPVTPAAANAI